MGNIQLETRNVGDLRGKYYLPAYQRGYRWGKSEIKQMLDDLYENGNKPYCLQPIAVKKVNDRYELIDGQQRLTTIFLIYKYFNSLLGGRLYRPKFSLEYETRKKSEGFLEHIGEESINNLTLRTENIDFYHIANAYEFICDYFQKGGSPDDVEPSVLTKLNEWFKDNVRIIWYEVDSSEDGIELFERLNIGKIPLTSSELVKALFLRDEAAGEMSGRQEEISLQWDVMEHSLRDSSLWAFLTNPKTENYSTRIDLILDLISGKAAKSKEAYHTFFYFDKEIKERYQRKESDVLLNTWNDIYRVYLTLREWHSDHEFYHKIGYLINSGSNSLSDIYKLWKGTGEDPLAKDIFLKELDRLIIESINIADRYALSDLTYSDDKTSKLLFLFNVETERRKDEGKRFFPFDKHREGNWSLEHIHAQHSENLKNNKLVYTWLTDHLRTLESSHLSGWESLGNELRSFKEDLEANPEAGHVRERFKDIHAKTIEFFTRKEGREGKEEYRDSIANLALLDSAQNAALSNYVFDVKRDIIISYDQDGRYIPFCTKMVFFKYYSPASASLHYWGEEDRNAYLNAINDVISPYYSNNNKSES